MTFTLAYKWEGGSAKAEENMQIIHALGDELNVYHSDFLVGNINCKDYLLLHLGREKNVYLQRPFSQIIMSTV